MEKLSRKFLASGPAISAGVKVGNLRTDMPEKIIQFGEGNFLRAFVDWMVNALNAGDAFNGSVVIAQPLNAGLADMINGQDGLYTLLMRGLENGEAKECREIITCVSRCINPYSQWEALMECARNPEMRYMFSNTTEAGIAYLDEARPVTACPASFPAKVCAYLYERFTHFNGAHDKGMVILCCELIEKNAATLKEIVLKLAAQWELEAGFADWLNNSCFFVNTLVDRIVPGYPREKAEAICNELGYTDQLLDTSELFHLWVVEGPAHLADELPFHKLGLNVVWTDDMTPYRTRKVRMLNGAHTSCTLGAFLAGLDTVGEMMSDEIFAGSVRQVLLEEILPNVPGDAASNKDFALSILDRFSNPYIRHELLSISLNSVSKWKVRVLPSLKDYIAATGALPPILTCSLASLIAFYNGAVTDKPELQGIRDGKPYAIKDGANELAFMAAAWQTFRESGDLRALVETILANDSFWGEDLTRIAGMTDFVAEKLQAILTDGSRMTVAKLLK